MVNALLFPTLSLGRVNSCSRGEGAQVLSLCPSGLIIWESLPVHHMKRLCGGLTANTSLLSMSLKTLGMNSHYTQTHMHTHIHANAHTEMYTHIYMWSPSSLADK